MKTYHEDRPWGTFDQFTRNEVSTVKLLYIKMGQTLSLQYHNHRAEFWRVISGNPEITIGDNVVIGHPEDEFSIPLHAQHRIAAPTDDVCILEISTGVFDESDIVRIDDVYHRT